MCVQSSDKTDDQKLVHKLERENDRLRAQLRDAEQQLRMSSAQMTADDDAATSSEATSHELQVCHDTVLKRGNATNAAAFVGF